MSFVNPDDHSNETQLPSWMKFTWVGVILFTVVALAISLTDDAFYFGFNHSVIIDRATLALAIAIGLCTFTVLRRAPQREDGLAAIFGSLLLACFVGAVIAAGANITANSIDHTFLFPSLGTRTFSEVEVPISTVRDTHGRGSPTIIIRPFSEAFHIMRSDKDWMFDQRRSLNPAINPDSFSVSGKFCLQLTIELSGKSGRLLHMLTLQAGSVHICPVGSGPNFFGLINSVR